MQTMYAGIPNSPSTTLSSDIDATQTTIPVIDPSKFPSAPNEATIGTGEDAETITYTGISGNDITGCTRGFEGTAKAWVGGTSIGRNFTNYDYSSIIANINTSININSVLRQPIINGNFLVNQRVVSGTVILTAGKYGHDRWRAGSAGCTYTFATVENVTTITITAGSLQQVIEGINLYSGTYTLSWIGNAQGKIGTGNYGNSGITGSITGGTNTTIEFGTGTLGNVQFNFGDTILSFSPNSFPNELLICQRYFEKNYNYDIAPGTTALQGITTGVATDTGIIIPNIFFKVKKRINSTLTIYSSIGTIGQVSIINTQTDAGATGITTLTNGEYLIPRISRAGGTTLTAGALYWFFWTSDAEL